MTFDVTLRPSYLRSDLEYGAAQHPSIDATPRSENVLIGEVKVSALRKAGVNKLRVTTHIQLA